MKLNIQHIILLVLILNSGIVSAQQDIDINQILAPANCVSETGQQSVTVQLINNGVTNLNGIPVTLEYSIDGGANFSFPEVFVPSTLNAMGNTESYTFSQPANFNSGQSYSVVVRINPQPAGEFDLIDQSTKMITVLDTDFNFYVRPNAIVNFTDSSAPAMNSWSWDFGDGNTSNLQSPSHTYASLDDYTVTLEASNGTCIGATTKEITVIPLVSEPLMQTLIGATTLTCPQDNTLTLQGSEVGVTYFLHNESTNTIVDSKAGTGNALTFQTGVVTETTTYHVAARANNNTGLDFDGSNDYVEVSSGVIPSSGDFSIAFWTKLHTVQGTFREFFSQGTAGNAVYISGTRGHTIRAGEDWQDTGFIYPDDDKYHHIALVKDGVNTYLYFDGVKVAEQLNNEIDNPANTVFRLGRQYGALNNNFHGELDHFSVWDKALSAAEIISNKENLLVGDEANLVAYYNFDDNQGLALTDLTGNGNNGNLLPDMDGGIAAPVNFPNGDWVPGIPIKISNSQTITRNNDIIYVDLNAAGADNGCDWTNAYTSVQSAVTAAISDQQIRIAQGTYQEGSEILINTPLTIKGGYDASDGSHNITNNPTILDGNNSHRILNLSAETVLIGLIIQNGRDYREVLGGDSVTSGGGILATDKLTGIQLIIRNNKAESNSVGSTSINATSFAHGGGIKGTTVILSNSQVIGNSASAFASTLTSSNSLSSANSTATGGGIEANSIQLINTQVINNLSHAFTTPSSSPEDPESYGGGVYGSLELSNSILWNNLAKTDGISVTTNASEHEGGAILTNHSLIKNQNPAGTSNIDATVVDFNPFFADEAGGDYRLQSGSPLINAGNNSYNTTTTDLDGNLRKFGIIDIGPYEHQTPRVGMALNVSVSMFQVRFDYYLENLSSIDLQNLTLAHDLDALFGAGNYSINTALSFVDDPSTINLNSGFNGSADNSILSTGSTLTGLDTAQIRLVVDVNTLVNSGNYSTQVTVNAQDVGMNTVTDLSDFSTETDANSNNNANETGENDATTFSIMTSPATFSMSYTPDSIAVNNSSTLQYIIDNSAGTTASNLAFSQTLPSGLVVADTANMINNCGGTFTASGTSIDLSSGSVNTTNTCTINVDIVATQGGTFNSTTGDLTSSAGNSGTANDTLTVDGAPTITLLGNPTVNLTVGDSYSDAGATASDVEDGDLTSSILITGSVDVNTANSYLIKYNVQDSAGNHAQELTRTVIVSEAPTYFVGGTVDGLFDGNFFVLKLNNDEEKIISQNGGYIFNTPLIEDDSYSVTMDLDPNNPIQPCGLSGDKGTINTEDIMNVDVLCAEGDDLIYRNGFETVE